VLSIEWDSKSDHVVLFGCSDSKIKLWNVDSSKVVCEMETSKDYPCVLDIVSSPTDAVFVSSSGTRQHETLEGGKGELILWSLQTGKRVNTFHIESAKSQVNSMVINHNGTMLVVGCGDGMIRVFDMVTALPIMGWPAHEGQTTSVRFCSDETAVLSCGLDGQIAEWSMHRLGKIMRSFKVEDAESYRQWPVRRCELSLDARGEFFVVSGSDAHNEALIYDCSNAPSPVQLIRGHSGPVLSVDWHASNIIATASADHTARISVVSAKSSLTDSKSTRGR
jgi:hypothetical protein